MQAYMKSELPFLGVQSSPRKRVQRRVFAEHFPGTATQWRRDVRDLFDTAEHRELWYAATDLATAAKARDFRVASSLSLMDHLIKGSAWWDVVDAVASHGVGDLLSRYPDQIAPKMLSWSTSSHLWRRRTSIICQLRFKASTDLELLQQCIAPNIADKDFFIRKAIGWALREYAKTDPDTVRRYVRDHEVELSGLSRREALKNIHG